jgi:hypothetical protein
LHGGRHDATLVVNARDMTVPARGQAAMDGTIFQGT